MNKKGISTLVIVAIVVIIIVVAGIAAYVLYSGGGGEPEATPTPTSSSPVEGATSMRFDVNATTESGLEIDRFTAKNLGTSNILIRVDQTDAQGNNFVYLMNETAQTAWANAMDTGFVDDSANFASYWDSTLIGNAALNNYMTALAGWSGSGDYNGDSYVIYNIVVNPDIPDSAFVPT
jgi:hypothetical protein